MEEGITLKKQKTVTCQKDILWFGYVYGRDGVRPDPATTQKLKEKLEQLKNKFDKSEKGKLEYCY